MESKILKENDEVLEVEVIFDVNDNGHDFNYKRYNLSMYKEMINAPETQRRIRNGYALGGYKHQDRNPRKLYQVDGIVCLKTLKMEYLGDGKIKHVQRIIKNDVGKEIIVLLKNGVGGFSSVHHLPTKSFAGFDYVHYPMFASNKLVHDNTCKNGVCGFDMDSVFSSANLKIDTELEKKGYSREVEKALRALEIGVLESTAYFKDMQKAKIEITILQKDLEEERNRFKIFKESVEQNKKDLGISSNWEIVTPASYSLGKVQEELQQEYKAIKEIMENGIQFRNKATEAQRQKYTISI